MIIQKTIKVRVNNFNKKYFDEIGYNVPLNTYITILVEKLPQGSGMKVLVKCDYCGKEFLSPWRRCRKGKCCCNNCRIKKAQEETIKKYGCNCPLYNPAIYKKREKTWIKKYGDNKYPLERKSIREKAQLSLQDSYGVAYPGSSPEIVEKITKTKYRKYGSYAANVSRQQKRICKLFGGQLNYPFDKYFLDCFCEEEKIDIEYDGGGHCLCVKLGNCTKEEFYAKQHKRDLSVIDSGIKIVRIVCEDDKLIKKIDLIKMKNKIIKETSKKDIWMVIYDVDKDKIKTLKRSEL